MEYVGPICNWCKLPGHLGIECKASAPAEKPKTMEEVIRAHALQVLDANKGCRLRTAHDLGVSTKTIYNWLHKWGVFEYKSDRTKELAVIHSNTMKGYHSLPKGAQ